MFQILQETDSAIHFLKILPKPGEKMLSLNAAAKKSRVTFLFLQKIARKLRIAGLIEAGHGVSGGYALKLEKNKISLRRIIETIEGRCGLTSCIASKEFVCPRRIGCTVRGKMCKINLELNKLLDKIKLSDL